MQQDHRVSMEPPPLRTVALIALLVLAALSEAAYLGLGFAAKSCLSEGAACGIALDTVSHGLFELGTGTDGTPRLYNMWSFGLPGLNNLFFMLLSPVDPGEQVKFSETVVISYVVGFMMISGFLATARGRGGAFQLLMAVLFGFGWYLLYNAAEHSIFPGDLSYMFKSRLPEVPIATVALLCLLPWTRNRAS